MGIIAVIQNNDKLYHEYCKNSTPIIVNKYPLNKPHEREVFNRLLLTQYEGDTISTVPRCECGKYNSGIFKNRICEVCGDKVLSDIERPVKFGAWLAAPNGIAALINPILLWQLYRIFNFTTYNLVEWVINPNYTVQGRKSISLQRLERSGIPRGINNFYSKPEAVLDILFTRPYLKSSCSIAVANQLKKYFLFHIQSGNFFCQHVPIQTKAMRITESNDYGKYAQELMLQGHEAAITLSNLDNSGLSTTLRVREAATARALIGLAKYHINDFEKTWSDKLGGIRNHIYSSRTDWTGRAVIGSISDPMAELDEMYIPWSIGLTLFEVHVTNKLLSRGYSQQDAHRMIESSLSNNLSLFKPLLERILDELLEECKICAPAFGHPSLFLRNPALTRGSSQCLRITKIKKDADDKIIEWHLLAYRPANADLDGDTMAITLIMDHYMFGMAKALQPHNYVMDLNRTFSVGPYLMNTNEAKITIRHWLESNY